MTRLEELHRAYEEELKNVRKDWVYVYNEAPPDDRIVEVWIMEEGVQRFGCRARFNTQYCCWLSEAYSFLTYHNCNIVAWKDL